MVADRGEPAVRYRLLETLRHYGEERLHERADTIPTRDRFLGHYLDLASRPVSYGRALDNSMLTPSSNGNGTTYAPRTTGPSRQRTSTLLTRSLLPSGHAPGAGGATEHGDWATRVLTLDTVDRHLNPTTYGWAAYWAYLGDDYDRAIALALHGVDVAPSPEDPDTTWCWTVLAWTYLAAGGDSQVHESAGHAQAAASQNPDLLEQAWAHMPLIRAAFDSQDAAVAGLVDRYVSLADRSCAIAASEGRPLPG